MKVYVQLQPHSRDWKPATVTECLDYNRYKVQVDFNGKKYTRNNIYIKPRTDEPRRSRRTIRKTKQIPGLSHIDYGYTSLNCERKGRCDLTFQAELD